MGSVGARVAGVGPPTGAVGRWCVGGLPAAIWRGRGDVGKSGASGGHGKPI
jgi:hypothetical protein